MTAESASPHQSLEDKTLPPPHPEGNLEVSIRTLASDLDLLQKSGGSVSPNARGSTLTVGAQGAVREQNTEKPTKDHSTMYIWGAIFVVGTIILFLMGYYLVPLVLNGSKDNTPNDGANSGVGTSTSQFPKNASSTATTNSPATHASFLKTSTPIVNLDLYNRAIPPDRAFFLSELNTQAAAVQGDFFEIVPRGSNQRPLTWAELTALMGAGGLNTTFLSSHFLPDYTMVVERQGKTLHPAYIFKLKSGETPLLLQREALALENNPNAFTNLFLNNPGLPVGTFKDAQISGQPIRLLSFASSSDKFLYGWFFNSYIIMSTSENSLRATFEHL